MNTRRPTSENQMRSTAAEPALTEKEARFVPEYLIDGNGKRAAIAAGYSEKTAVKIASELLQRPRISAAINAALKAQEARTLVRADANLKALERIACTAEGMRDFAAAIRARELIGKHYKSFSDRLEVVVTTPRGERLRAARERRAGGQA